jgi:hypothetical protein
MLRNKLKASRVFRILPLNCILIPSSILKSMLSNVERYVKSCLGQAILFVFMLVCAGSIAHMS